MSFMTGSFVIVLAGKVSWLFGDESTVVEVGEVDDVGVAEITLVVCDDASEGVSATSSLEKLLAMVLANILVKQKHDRSKDLRSSALSFFSCFPLFVFIRCGVMHDFCAKSSPIAMKCDDFRERTAGVDRSLDALNADKGGKLGACVMVSQVRSCRLDFSL